jgi:hypothetical protein
MNRTDVSRLALFIYAAWILLVGFFYYPKWNYPQTEATISWDVSGYYFYLPAIFIYKDLKQQKFKEVITKKYNPTPDPYQSYRHSSGNLVMKYSSGMAVLYLPFFTMAHMLAKPLGYPADGFSFPYQLAIGIGSMLISLIGLFFLRNILIRYFSEKVTAIILLILVFSTNYLEYAAISSALTHNYLFTLYAILLVVTDNYYKAPKIKTAFLVGLLVGIMTLVRPTEMVSLLIPLLWKIKSLKDARERILFFTTNYLHVVVAAAGIIIFGSIQLIYWKYVTGEWLVYSYGNEGFDFLRPHIIKCLFSFRKGWFIYTPVMIFAIAGFYFVYTKYKQFLSLFLFTCIFMYINFSWQTWWYAGSLGQRTMVQAYPVLAFPLAAFINEVLVRRWKQIVIFLFIGIFTYYNLWLHHQAHKGGLLEPEYMTRAYFMKTVLRNKVPAETFKLLDTDEWFEGRPSNQKKIYSHNDTIRLTKDVQFSEEKGFHLPEANWIRVEGKVFLSDKEDNVWNMAQVVVRIFAKNEKLKERQIRLQRFIPQNQLTPFYFDVRIPERSDSVRFLFWNAGSQKPVIITDTKVSVFN